MTSPCLGRVKDVLDDWKDKGHISELVADGIIILFRDKLYGSGRFTNVIEILGPDIKITVRLFAGLQGDDRALRDAYAYLLNLPAMDASVTIQRDIKSGNVGASVTFPCASNRHQIESNFSMAMNKMTTYLETRYDKICTDLLELGVTFKNG